MMSQTYKNNEKASINDSEEEIEIPCKIYNDKFAFTLKISFC